MSWTDNFVAFDWRAARQDRAIVSADILDCVELALDIEDRGNASVQINCLIMPGLDTFRLRDKNPVGHNVRWVMTGGERQK